MANCRENMMLSRKQEVHPHFVADNRLVQRSQASAPVMCCCMDQFILQLFGALGLSGTCLSPKLPYPLGNCHHYITHCSSGQAHSSSQTASYRFSFFCMGPKCYAVQCIVSGDENPPNCPFSLGFCYPYLSRCLVSVVYLEVLQYGNVL